MVLMVLMGSEGPDGVDGVSMGIIYRKSWVWGLVSVIGMMGFD